MMEKKDENERRGKKIVSTETGKFALAQNECNNKITLSQISFFLVCGRSYSE